MAKEAIGLKFNLFKTKSKRRSKPSHLRGSKKLGPKDPNRGNRGKH